MAVCRDNHILVYFGSEIFSRNSFHKEEFLQIIHVDNRKMWHGDAFAKLIFTTKQRNTKFMKMFHCQNRPVYSDHDRWKFSWV